MYGNTFPSPSAAPTSNGEYLLDETDDQWCDDLTNRTVPLLQPRFPFQFTALPLSQLSSPIDLRSAPQAATTSLNMAFNGGGVDPRFAPGEVRLQALGAGESQPLPTGYLGPVAPTYHPIAHSPPNWPGMAYNVNPQHSANKLTSAHAFQDSSSPEACDDRSAQDPGKLHRRGYQACQNCRSRKVKVSPPLSRLV